MGGVCSCCGADKKIDEGERHAHNQRSAGYAVPTKKVLDFGFQKDFSSLFSVGRELGKGQYGTTFECTDINSKDEYAVKKVVKSSLTDKQAIDDLEREVKILTVLKGRPNIVHFYGAYEDDEAVYMVLEYAQYCRGGELFQRLLDKGKYSEKDASVVMRQILQAVADCHTNGVIHRDLKPENFLYGGADPAAPLKVTDFGLSDFFDAAKQRSFDDVAGSAYYVAPEVLRRKYGPMADLWSCGVMMYILLTGEVPFWAPTEAGIFKQVLGGQLDLNAGPCKNLSHEAKQLLLSLLTRDVKDGAAPDAPLDVLVVQNIRKFSGYNRVKQAILVEIAKTFEASEIVDLRRQFALLDKDGSGTISIEEMVNALSDLRTGESAKNVFSAQEIQEMMKTLDVDGDGMVDYMEFVAASMSAYQMSHGLLAGSTTAWQNRVRVVFDKIDEDGNGFISKDELAKLMGDDASVREVIAEADKDGNGLIDFEEFHVLLRNVVRRR